MGKPSSPPAAHSVFWDLYCAAPDRREACEHSSEAKAFQDYVSPRPRDWDQASWAGACGLGGLHGPKLAWMGRWAGLWGLTEILATSVGFLCPQLGPGSPTE